MPQIAADNQIILATDTERAAFYRRATVLLIATVIVCATLIVHYTDWQAGSFMAEFSSIIDVGINTLLPYMISAVIAAITAIAIMAMIPAKPAPDQSYYIAQRLRGLVQGDLYSKVAVKSEGNLREVSYELNRAIATLNSQVSKLKVLNRQQWDSLCEIRAAVEGQDGATALRHIQNMEQNWTRIAEIEKTLTT
jgi:hypothetical protein